MAFILACGCVFSAVLLCFDSCWAETKGGTGGCGARTDKYTSCNHMQKQGVLSVMKASVFCSCFSVLGALHRVFFGWRVVVCAYTP